MKRSKEWLEKHEDLHRRMSAVKSPLNSTMWNIPPADKKNITGRTLVGLAPGVDCIQRLSEECVPIFNLDPVERGPKITQEQVFELQNLKAASALTTNATSDKFAEVMLFDDGQVVFIEGDSSTNTITAAKIRYRDGLVDISKGIFESLKKRYSRS